MAVSDPVPPAAPRRALVVDDEQPLAMVVAGYLEREGFEVALASDGPSAVQLAREQDPAVVVLDLGLPGLDGVEVCRSIRTFSDCYILMLTARVDEVDMLIGLSVGADDYMTKPFSPRELVARIAVMMRRPRAAAAEESAPLVSFGALAIDVRGREVSLKGRPVPLTRIEFDVLAALALNPGQVFTRQALINAVWGGQWVGDDHLVDVHVLHIRQKLGDTATEQNYVRTVRGVGYRMGPGR
ncbi:response regulator transcription factor [uncultured Microbacterium sp.]|uniref:DNA-binding response regulator MtrA n=1 Tax=uncultured Microbacterium sp. TaxID=191216 RepID=A0A1Y5NZG5_9MICO|nr:response regulator transcription factor [uncultured Microbacterium sp.]SBS71793.1 DNA-binding response regulator MtrA [uncultured Microbacterium sp.]